MSRITAFLLALLLSLPALAAEGGDDWTLIAKARSPEDITLWTRVVPGAQLKAFRGATHTDMPLPNIAALIYDGPTMCRWIFRCRDARFVGTADNGDSYIHIRIKGIWPMADRDAVIRAHPAWNTRTGELTVTGVAAPDYLPHDPAYVRIPTIESSWRIAPAGNNLTVIEWSGHVDPSGNIPRWIANAVATLVPRHTLRELHDLLQEARWRSPAARDSGNAILQQVRTQLR